MGFEGVDYVLVKRVAETMFERQQLGLLVLIGVQQITLMMVFYQYSLLLSGRSLANEAAISEVPNFSSGANRAAILAAASASSSDANRAALSESVGAASSAADHAKRSTEVLVPSSVASRYRTIRDVLSRELNNLKQEYGKRVCEMNELMGKKLNMKPGDERQLKWAESGGWCLQASKSRKQGGQHGVDITMAAQLSSFLAGKVVASFGDGPGEYKRVIEGMKQVQAYDAYDGSPYSEEVSDNRAKFLDLSSPQYGLPLYDWVLCIEVAEHVPGKYEAALVDNLARHAKEGIILSWGMPGQPGLAHVNNQPFSHVKQIMETHGFSHDEEASDKIKNAVKDVPRKMNLNVWRRTGKAARADEA